MVVHGTGRAENGHGEEVRPHSAILLFCVSDVVAANADDLARGGGESGGHRERVLRVCWWGGRGWGWLGDDLELSELSTGFDYFIYLII